MRVPMPVLKLTLMVPALLTSAVLVLSVLALMPPMLSVTVTLVLVAGLVVLAAGLAQRRLASMLTWSRPASPAERAVLAPVLGDRVAAVVPAEVYVRRTGRDATPAVRIGRDLLVVTPWFIDAVYRRRLSVDEAVAVVIHAEGAHRAGRHRLEVLTLVATAPWRAALAVCHLVGRTMAWFPLVRPVWALRGVVGAVAVVQSTFEGRAWAGIGAGVFIALTYAIPAARRSRDQAMLAAGDDLVVAHGLGPVLARLLRRAGVPLDLDRQLRLGHPGDVAGQPADPFRYTPSV